MVFFFLSKNRACDAQSRGFEAGDGLTLIIAPISSPDECPDVKILHHIFASSFIGKFLRPKKESLSVKSNESLSLSVHFMRYHLDILLTL